MSAQPLVTGDRLETVFRGDLIRRGDPSYDSARRVFNALVDRRPEVIARPLDEIDVAAAIARARGRGLPLAVRGGGHSPFAVADDAVVLDMRSFKRILVDPARRTVRVGGGVTWGELDPVLGRHDLALTGARFPSVGVVGFTLGSGSGWLERKFGLAADSLVSASVVTADGRLVRAAADENPELFWALRGGGGNFGVVTELEFLAHPIGDCVTAGMLLYDGERAEHVVAAYRDFVQSASQDVCGGVALRLAPPAPFVPDGLRGRPVAAIVFLHAGDVADGREAHIALRAALGQPDADLVRPIAYPEFQRMFAPREQEPLAAGVSFGLVDELDEAAVATVAAEASGLVARDATLILQPLGGAIDDAAPGTTALGRDGRWIYQAVTMWKPGDATPAQTAWIDRIGRSLGGFARTPRFANFLTGTGDDLVRSAYGEHAYARLQAVKAEWDPHNVFRLNQNIPPRR